MSRFLERDFRGPVSQAIGMEAGSVPAGVKIGPEPPQQVRLFCFDKARCAEGDPTGRRKLRIVVELSARVAMQELGGIQDALVIAAGFRLPQLFFDAGCPHKHFDSTRLRCDPCAGQQENGDRQEGPTSNDHGLDDLAYHPIDSFLSARRDRASPKSQKWHRSPRREPVPRWTLRGDRAPPRGIGHRSLPSGGFRRSECREE